METQQIITIVIMVISFLVAFVFLGSGKVPMPGSKKQENDSKANKNLTKVLKRFATMRNFTVLGKTKIVVDGEEFNFDAILLGFYGTIGIKTVDYSGEVYGQPRDKNWVHMFEGKKTEFQNPVESLNGSVRFFKDFYKKEKIKGGNSDAMVVFASNTCEAFIGKSDKALQIDKLYNTLNASTYIKDNGASIEDMKNAIEKYTVV